MAGLRFHQFGNPTEVLTCESVELAPTGPGEVRLKVLASPINPADLNFIEGTYGVKPGLPAIPGIEACGEVLESRDERFAAGDRCIFLRRTGLWANEVKVSGETLFKLPPDLDPRQAAMLKVNPATAWRLLTGFTEPPRGSWIVQNAANSGVGRCVIQLARSLGIRTINLVRRTELIPRLVMLGADHVLLDDADAVDGVRDICGKLPPVLAFNAVGGESALRLMNCLSEGGTHVTYGAMARRPLTVPNGLMIFKDLRLRGLWITKWIENAPRSEIDATYTRLAAEMGGGRLTMPVDSTHALENFSEALDRLDATDRNGKVLLVP